MCREWMFASTIWKSTKKYSTRDRLLLSLKNRQFFIPGEVSEKLVNKHM